MPAFSFVWTLCICSSVSSFHIHHQHFGIAERASMSIRTSTIPIVRNSIEIADLYTVGGDLEHRRARLSPNEHLSICSRRQKRSTSQLYGTKLDVEPQVALSVEDLSLSSSQTEDEDQSTQNQTANTSTNTNKVLNGLLLIACFGFVTYSVLNVDSGMTRGWTMGEKAMRIPLDNWASYESSLNTQPIVTKTTINVVIYLLGDWLSQTIFVNKNLLEFDAWRTTRNGLIGLVFGPLAHEYYEFSDSILPVEVGVNRFYKIIMDQTIYLGTKCSVYIVAVNMLAGESWEYSSGMAKDKIKGIMLTAWKFWPLVHIVTYGFIPARHRILWVNCVDLFWNAILALKTSAPEEDSEEKDAALAETSDNAESADSENASVILSVNGSTDERKDPRLMTQSDADEIIQLVSSSTLDPEQNIRPQETAELRE